jgi:hypothetical protein
MKKGKKDQKFKGTWLGTLILSYTFILLYRASVAIPIAQHAGSSEKEHSFIIS